MNDHTTRLASFLGDPDGITRGLREGMALELLDASGAQVAEVFEDELTKVRTFSTSDGSSLDVAVLQWFLREAEARL